jgi:hypothetical protein
MSEDRLDKALEEMKHETVDAATLEDVRARVWSNVSNVSAGCREFRPDLPAYSSGTLTGGRRVLLEDHISRCPRVAPRSPTSRANGASSQCRSDRRRSGLGGEDWPPPQR